MPPYAKLVRGKSNHAPDLALVKSETILGRSETCDLQLDDPFVSRRQARISRKGDQITIQNLGKNAILVNAEPTEQASLEDGDMILMGNTQLVFRLEYPVDLFGDPIPEDVEPASEMTVMLQGPPLSKEPGPRLVVLEPDGHSRVYPLRGDYTDVGRSTDCDVQLMDASVSRIHARIEKRGEAYHLIKLSKVNPLLVNGNDTAEKRLYAGDEFRIGPFQLSFMSDRKDDLRPVETRSRGDRRMNGRLAWVALALGLLAVSGYFVYTKLYLPWNMERQIAALARTWAAGDTETTRKSLEDLISRPLTEGARAKALELLSAITVAQSDRLIPEGKFNEARSILNDFLSKYGAEKASDPVEARMDQLRLQTGQQLQIGGDSLGALREFSSIAEDSPHYEEAQRALSHIWRVYQKDNVTIMPLAQLMAEADAHFAAKRYTTPIGKNAYAIYQTILSLDPNNQVARERIEQMKLFYKERGQRLSQQKNCAGALISLERALLISPEDTEIKDMIQACKRPRSSGGPRRPRTQQDTGSGATDQQVERILTDTETPPPLSSP